MPDNSIKDLKEKGLYYFKAKEYAEAAKYFKIAAENGDAEALYVLGFLYKNGVGLGQNYKEAVKYYQLIKNKKK